MTGSKKSAMNFSETIYFNYGVDLLKNVCNYTNINPTSPLAKYIAEKADGKMALDHYVKDTNGDFASIQSRFRGKEYDYNDFTIRYDLPDKDVKCEYYHLDADLFFYGRTDGDSKDPDSVTKITKWILVDANKLKSLFKYKKIVPDEKITKSEIIDNVLHCSIKTNKDANATRLLTIPTLLLSQISKDVIIYAEGFPTESENETDFTFKHLKIKQPETDKSRQIYDNLGEKLLEDNFNFKTIKSSDEFENYLFNKTASKLNVNCHLQDEAGDIVGLFFRFRDKNAENYNDFTIRYDYKNGKVDPNIEYQNLNADLMFYAICDNYLNTPNEIKSFKKWILINLAEIRSAIKNDIIKPQEKIKKSFIEDETLYCKIKSNYAINDSRFITIDVKDLNQVCPNAIVAQKNYLT